MVSLKQLHCFPNCRLGRIWPELQFEIANKFEGYLVDVPRAEMKRRREANKVCGQKKKEFSIVLSWNKLVFGWFDSVIRSALNWTDISTHAWSSKYHTIVIKTDQIKAKAKNKW